MKIYLVGGAVRDKLLGLPVKERDWVVVGATVKEMLDLGYQQVGKEFPVFLHPKTHEEYALARTERKVEPGYKGFIFNADAKVSLIEDLKRRDLTINAMAETESGEIIDPFQGKKDLKQKWLRHISSAFKEDPVRILRVGRFLSRYANLGFRVAPETYSLMQEMVANGEVDALVPERVWKELERALQETNPELFFLVLDKCHALQRLFPNFNLQGRGFQALQKIVSLTSIGSIRFAVLLHDLPLPKKNIVALCERYRIPNEYRDLALITAMHYTTALKAKDQDAPTLLKLCYEVDIFRKEKRFHAFLIACEGIALTHDQAFDSTWLLQCAKAAKTVDVQKLIAQGFTGGELATQLKKKREENIQQFINTSR